MPEVTENQGLPYPLPPDPNNVPKDLLDLAASLEDRLVQYYANGADRSARNPAPRDGEVCYVESEKAYYVRLNGVWLQGPVPGQRIQHGRATIDMSSLAGGATGTIQAISFPQAFSGAPEVIVQHTQSNVSLVLAVWGTSASGFSITPRNVGSTAFPAGASVVVHWIAAYG